jgi:hypothetical protein
MQTPKIHRKFCSSQLKEVGRVGFASRPRKALPCNGFWVTGEIGPYKIGPYEIGPSNRNQRNRTLQNRPTLKNIFKAVLFLHYVGPISPIYFQVS